MQEGLTGCALTAAIARRRRAFLARFDATFGLRGRGLGEGHVRMARAALSNYLGGLGFWHGRGLRYGRRRPTAPQSWAGEDGRTLLPPRDIVCPRSCQHPAQDSVRFGGIGDRFPVGGGVQWRISCRQNIALTTLRSGV